MYSIESLMLLCKMSFRESRKWVAGALTILPLLVSATAPQETFLPPQTIPLPGTMTFNKLVVADVNADGYDDLVAIGTHSGQVVIDLYLNEGQTRNTSEAVNFVKQRLPLKTHANSDAVADKVHFSGGFDLQVVDLDNDGSPDILASSERSGEIFVLWNQGPSAPKPFVFTEDTADPASTSMTITSPLAIHRSLSATSNDVLGTPIYVTAADLGDGSGYKSIVAYHGALRTDSRSTSPSPFNQHNYEALAIFHASGARSLSATESALNFFQQRNRWVSFDKRVICDLSFGSKETCPIWNDGMLSTPSDSVFLYNFRVSDENGRSAMNFADAPSDILQLDDTLNLGTPKQAYMPGTYRPNASPGLQVQAGRGPGGSDAIWLQGGGKVYEFVADNDLLLMRRRTAIDAVIGNERSAGSTFATLSTGSAALITAGGMRVVYDPTDPTSAVDQSVPDYLNRNGQIGAWLGWASLDSGPALLSLSDYCRSPDPCASQFYWSHNPLDGSTTPKYIVGGSSTLVMLDFARETSGASGTQFKPFFQEPDDSHFQAFTIRGGPLNHKPFIAAGHFASPTESALIMLDHTDGENPDPTWNHLSLYRPDTAKTYVSPTPQLDGLTVGRFIEDGLADVGITLPQGEISAVLVGANLGTDTPDGIRYVTVHDKTSGTMKGIFPVSPAETVKVIGKDSVVVSGLSALGVGHYTLDVHNATATASMNLNVINPFGITTTDFDWRANSACGLLPNTKDGNLWPKQIAVSVTNFPGAVQAVRWMNLDDGTAVNLGSDAAVYDATSSTVTLIVPQDKLKDGHWQPAIEAGGMWQPIKRTWNVSHDTAALASCAQQLNVVNEEAYSQCTDNDYYLAPAQYAQWPHLASGSFRFFGSGFEQKRIKSAAIKQGNHRYFSVSLKVINDNEADVNFGDLTGQLTAGSDTDLYFYSENGEVVSAGGVPAVGAKQHWRTARAEGCAQAPPNFSSISGGSGKDGAYQAGDVVTATGENLMYPVPTAIRLFLTDKDSGAQYALPSNLPVDFYTTHYDNSHGKLVFVIPQDDAWELYLVAPPTHLSGLPALQVAFSAQAGLTTISEFTLSKLTVPGALGWAFMEGIYMSGNTPTGVLNFLRNSSNPNPNPVPGIPGDDQPRNGNGLWIAEYVSNTGEGEDPNLYVVVFTANASNWLSQLSGAIYAQGRGVYSNDRVIAPWPCDGSYRGGGFPTYACVVYAAPVTATNPEGIPFSYVTSLWNLFYIPNSTYTGSVKRIVTGVSSDTPAAAASWLPVPHIDDQFFWRVANPSNYWWMLTTSVAGTLVTGPANNCAYYWAKQDSLCYQAGIAP
ncbi:MAG: VCBS repeat-containing protein [Rudaea sp.]